MTRLLGPRPCQTLSFHTFLSSLTLTDTSLAFCSRAGTGSMGEETWPVSENGATPQGMYLDHVSGKWFKKDPMDEEHLSLSPSGTSMCVQPSIPAHFLPSLHLCALNP